MTTTPTTNYAWLKPDVGSEVDTWGTVANAIYDAIDTKLFSKVGNTANQTLVPDGTSAAPGLAFASGTGVGLYRPGANSLGIVASTLSILTLDGNGLAQTPRTGAQLIAFESTNNTCSVQITASAADAVLRALVRARRNRNGAAVNLNDNLGGMLVQGYDGAAYQDCGQFSVRAEDTTPGAAAMGGRFRINLCPKGSITLGQALDITIDTGLEMYGNVVIDSNRVALLRSTAFASALAGAVGKIQAFTDNGGSLNRHNGTAWVNSNNPTVQTIGSNAAFTITPNSSGQETLHTGTLTANRAVTLAASQPGDWCRITRTGAGAFTLDVGTGPLKSLATNTWGIFITNAAGAWYLASYGTL